MKLARGTRWVAVTAALTFALGGIGALSGTGAGAQGSSNPAPTASENGVTKDTITITVVAAVDVPGISLFGGAFRGVQAWADYTNATGGLAGRKIKVKTVDSKLSGDEARNAFIQACNDSFALIGTSVLLLNNFNDLTSCADKTGAATGLPDFPVVVTEVGQQCSPVSFTINPSVLECATKDQHPQTYQANVGAATYLVKKLGKMKGAMIYPDPTQSASAKAFQIPLFRAESQRGISTTLERDISTLAVQSEYTPIAAAIKDSGAQWVQNGNATNSAVLLRKEAKLQGVDSVKAWYCTLQCYDQSLLTDGGAEVEGEYVSTSFLPFLGKNNEGSTNKLLKAFLKYDKQPDGFGLQAFAAGILFRDAVNKAIGGDPNKLTRKAVLAAANTIHNFDADGMIGSFDAAGRKSTACFVMLKVHNGEFQRVYPTKKGTFDCNPKNVINLKMDLIK